MSVDRSTMPTTMKMLHEMQSRKQCLAARIRDMLERVLRETAHGSAPSFIIAKACKEGTYFDQAAQMIKRRAVRQERLIQLGKREHFRN